MSIFSLLLGKQYNVLTYLPETVLVVDDNGKILYANKSAQRLFETPKLRNKNVNDYFMINFEHIIKNKDTDTKQILKIVTAAQNTKITDVKITDVSGKNKRYILTIIDNTQDHSLLDQLITEKQNQKIINHNKNLLLYKMGNYLTSPLHSIVGFSQTMLFGLSGDLNEKQKKYLEIINSNSSELLLFFQKLIELSQSESDIYKFDFNIFDISSVLSVILNEFQVKIQNKDIKLSVNTSDLLTNSCYSDKTSVKNIIKNILDNAVEVIETGSISMNLLNPTPEFLISKGFDLNSNVNEKSYLLCEIEYKGIDESQYSSYDIFNPYIQVDKNSKKYLLQSLLLGSAYNLVAKLKGLMWIQNTAHNQVSFIFTIPVEKAIIEDKQ